MFFLASLMGMIGVGAASFAVVQLQQDDDDDDLIEEPAPDLENGNLLDQVSGLDALQALPEEHEDEDDLLYNDIGIPPLKTSTFPGHPSSDTDPNLDEIFATLNENSVQGDMQEDFSNDALLNSLLNNPVGDDLAESDDDLITDIEDKHDNAFSGEVVQNALAGEWINEGRPAEVFDYEAGKENLMLVWDDMANGAQEPEVAIESDAYDPEVMHVMMNGGSVAEIYGDPELSVSDVTLIPLSSALIAGLEPA